MLFLSEVQEGMQHADLVFPVCVSHSRSGERSSLSAVIALVQTQMREAVSGISPGSVRASGMLPLPAVPDGSVVLSGHNLFPGIPSAESSPLCLADGMLCNGSPEDG